MYCSYMYTFFAVPFSAGERDQLKELPKKECIFQSAMLYNSILLHFWLSQIFLHIVDRFTWQGKQKNSLLGLSGHHLCIWLRLPCHTGREKCKMASLKSIFFMLTNNSQVTPFYVICPITFVLCTVFFLMYIHITDMTFSIGNLT